jgi:HEAT repeat protein
VPALIEIFEANLSRSSQEAAASAFGSIGPPARQAAPSLVRNLADTNSFARLDCVRALGRIQAEPRLAVPALMKTLNDPHPGVRQLATEALGQFGADARPAVPALIEIYDRNTAESSHAVTALGLIGPAAKPAVPTLVRGLANTEPDSEFRLQCIWALGRIHAEPELAVPALMDSLGETLSDTDVRVRLFSTTALGQYGPDARPAVPLLTNLLQDPNPNVRLEATNALKLIDPAAAAQAGIK